MIQPIKVMNEVVDAAKVSFIGSLQKLDPKEISSPYTMYIVVDSVGMGIVGGHGALLESRKKLLTATTSQEAWKGDANELE